MQDASTGSLDASETNGGTGNIIFTWSDGSNGQEATNLSAGSYHVTATDVNGCIATKSNLVVGEPNRAIIEGVPSDATCNSATDGGVQITVTEGNGGYTYAWSNGSSDKDLSGVAAGDYTVIVTHGNCTDDASFTVSAPEALSAFATPSNATCNGVEDGSIKLEVEGGTPPYAFNWSSGETTQNLFFIAPQTYSVTILDANLCFFTIENIEVTQPSALSISAMEYPPICPGDADGRIDLTVSGGTGPYSYAWSNGYNTEDANLLGPDNYSVQITDANGCQMSESFVFDEPSPMVVDPIIQDESCYEAGDGSISLSVMGGVGPYTYSWFNGATTSTIENLNTSDVYTDGNFVEPGYYGVTITDANGCELPYYSEEIMDFLELLLDDIDDPDARYHAKDIETESSLPTRVENSTVNLEASQSIRMRPDSVLMEPTFELELYLRSCQIQIRICSIE